MSMVIGGVAAAFFGSAAAHADDSSWSPIYDTDSATLVQVLGRSTLTWDVPASFTNGTTTLSGTDYVAPSAGGFNDEFVTNSGAVYDQDQLFPGFTNLYYDAGTKGATAVDVFKTPFGDIPANWAASQFTPADPTFFITSTEALANSQPNLDVLLNLGPDSSGLEGWSPVDGTVTEVANKGAAPVWEVPATFSPVTDAGVATLTGTESGTEYLAPSPIGGYDFEFVTNTGAVYDEDILFQEVVNLYYDSGAKGASPVDILYTPFGHLNISWAASLFTPTNYASAVAVTPTDDLTNAGLYSALDLGLTAAHSAAAEVVPADFLSGL